MRRLAVNLMALATICAGAAHLSAQEAPEDDLACCTSGIGVKCCGTVCMAGLFRCEVLA